METLTNFVGGRWVPSRATEFLDVHNPATGEVIARTPLSTGERRRRRRRGRREGAFRRGATRRSSVRARAMFRFRELLEEHFEELARIVTTEHGKTLDESRGSVRRGIECVEVACGAPSLMMGYGLENIARGIDCHVLRQPLGVCAAIAPFNFPAMVPLWFLPFAVATGNTFVVKPSEQVPLSQRRIVRAARALRPAARRRQPRQRRPRSRGRRSATIPDIRAVSFVGSTPVAKAVYRTRDARRQARAGPRRRQELHRRDARRGPRPRRSSVDHRILLRLRRASAASRAACSCRSATRTTRRASGWSRRRGPCASATAWSRASTMGPVISAKHRDRVLGYIEKGVAEGRELLVDGRRTPVADRPNGFFLGPTLFDDVDPAMAIGREEIFGPVASITPVQTLEEARRSHARAPATPTRRRSSPRAARRRASSRRLAHGLDGRREHRRRGADGVLPVRRRARTASSAT